METASRKDLGHRTAVALVPLLARPRVVRWLRRRGIAGVWHHLQPQLTGRPELAEAVNDAAAAPGKVTRRALARELRSLLADDPDLADLVHAALEDERAERVERVSRVSRWGRDVLVLVLVVVAVTAISVVTGVGWLARDQSDLASHLALSTVIAGAAVFAVILLYRRLGRLASLVNLVVLLTVTGAVVSLLAGSDTPERDLDLAKIVSVLVLTAVPGWLYFQFVALRGRVLWEDYVTSLFQLGADEPRNLPEPPAGTRAHELWRGAGAPSDSGRLYRDKFEAAHGKAVLARHWETAARRRRGDGFAPVVLLTVLTALGWTAVLLPFAEGGALLSDPQLGGTLGGTLAFAFAGAYWFNLQSLVRRYFQNDLGPNAYISGICRVIIVLLLVAAVYQVWPGSADPGALFALAFLIGAFPRLGLQLLEKAVLKAARLGKVPGLREQFPLTHLDGLNLWYESRLVEEGIEDMQNLATAHMVEMLLSTRVPIGRLVDWVDQAYLYLRVEDSKQRDGLRRLGIRSATDLQHAFPATAATVASASSAEPWRDRARQVCAVLDQDDADPVATVDMLLAGFQGEPNLKHVRSYRSWAEPGNQSMSPLLPAGSPPDGEAAAHS